MNRRGKRLHWGTVRDHAEAWHFQLTRETTAITPDPVFRESLADQGIISVFELKACLRMLSALSGSCVIVEERQDDVVIVSSAERPVLWDLSATTRESVRDVVRAAGFRVVEQRFPP